MLISTRWQVVLLLALFCATSLTDLAFAQVEISVNSTTPCFLNSTASYQIFENCNIDNDFVAFALMGWEWISGGYFSMIVVSVLIVSVWKKYNEGIYAVYIGIVFLPISFMFFPEVFVSWAIVMAFLGVGVWIWYALVKQTE